MTHNHSAGLGAGLACAGIAFLFVSALGFGRRNTAHGQKLANSSADQRAGVPFANRNYYQMSWAPIMAVLGVVLLIAGAIWFFAAGG